MNDTSQHLTLEEFTGDAELTAAARAHLTACAHCEAEARDWTALADGAALIFAGTRQPPAVLDGVLGTLGRPAAAVRGRKLLPYAAAAAVLLGAGGYGLSAALTPGGQAAAQDGHAAMTAATLAPTGCTSLDLATGTLTRVSGTNLILTVPGTSRQFRVTTSTGTTFLRVTNGTLADVTDGAHVLVSGTASAGILTAVKVTILPGAIVGPPAGGQLLLTGMVTGAVADVSSGGFTVIAVDGQRYRIATRATTQVVDPVRISVDQLKLGEQTTASGSAERDGTLIASSVEQIDLPGAGMNPHPAATAVPTILATLPPGAAPPPSAPATDRMRLNSLGCAPTAVTTAYLLSTAG